jgi:hypothetical protein
MTGWYGVCIGVRSWKLSTVTPQEGFYHTYTVSHTLPHHALKYPRCLEQCTTQVRLTSSFLIFYQPIAYMNKPPCQVLKTTQLRS